MCMSNIFSQKIFHFFERKIFLIQVIWLFRSKNNPIVFCFSANINFLSTVKTNKWWKKKNIHSITRDHTHGGPYHTTVWHSRTRQEHQGIQALYQRIIWENSSSQWLSSEKRLGKQVAQLSYERSWNWHSVVMTWWKDNLIQNAPFQKRHYCAFFMQTLAHLLTANKEGLKTH